MDVPVTGWNICACECSGDQLLVRGCRMTEREKQGNLGCRDDERGRCLAPEAVAASSSR